MRATKWRMVGGVALLAVAVFAEPVYRQLGAIPTGRSLTEQEAEIYAAVLRQVSTIRDAQGEPWAAFCVEVLREDPSDLVLQRLGPLSSPVKPLSRCAARDSLGHMRAPDNHLILRVTSRPAFISGGLAKVAGGDYLGDMAATGYEFVLVRGWGRWWTVRRALVWIS